MAKIVFILITVLLFVNRSFADGIEQFNRYFKLLPVPLRIEVLAGNGILFSDIRNICLKNTDQIPVLSGLLEGLPCNGVQKTGTLNLIIDKKLDVPSSEGYILEIKDGQVFIRAREQAGLFYGIQTLSQLLEDSHDQSVKIPSCKISDYPKIATRAVHIDLKSHLDAGNYYYSIIDRLAKVKINTVIIEFEDKLRYRKAAAVGAPDAISIEEFVAISRYAKQRNIEISPLVQGLGHASFILKHDEYRELRDDSLSDYVFDPLNPKTYELQFSLYEDAIAATPFGKYLHVGGDEVGKLGKSVLAKQSGMKPLELQMYWLKKVTDFATAHHRIPIFWDDMVFKIAGLYQTTYDTAMSVQAVTALWSKSKGLLDENISLFPENCIYSRWNYEAPEATGNKMAMDWYNEHHLEVMPAAAAMEGYLMLQRNHSNFKPIKDFCRITAAKKIDKILCTVWDDSSPHFETVWRGIYDFAFFSWNDIDAPEAAVHATYRQRFFGAALASDSLDFQNALEDAVTLWETLFLNDGDRENYQPEFNLIDVPDISRAGEWSKKYMNKIGKAKNAVSVYGEIKKKITKSLLLAGRNRYALEVLNEINEVQVYSSKLLLLLNEFDTSADKQRSKMQIEKYLAEFTRIRKDFEGVYSVTRMLENPEGYVRDMNPRMHWADVGNNTDWIYYIELKMNRKVSDWVNSAM